MSVRSGKETGGCTIPSTAGHSDSTVRANSYNVMVNPEFRWN